CAGATVMPGLVESHCHLTFPSALGHIDPSFNPPLDVSFPNNPIGRNARDLELFVRLFGYPPAEALRAATQYGGQVMDLPVGLLTPGYLADVLVVRGEPAEDVSVLQDTENLLAIMQNGAFWKLADQLTAA
ncbi:MAG TPA: amidohydrolase family protein, partial [Streptosporangiaceae bacterium]